MCLLCTSPQHPFCDDCLSRADEKAAIEIEEMDDQEEETEGQSMNFPGIGNSQLSRDKVEPILQAHFKDLPVTVCVL